MAPRFLLGPVTNSWAMERLPTSLFGDRVRTFGWGEDTDASFDACDSWDELVAKIATSERPDGLLLLIGGVALPSWIWTAPVPTIALAANPPGPWHHLRKSLRRSDRIITGTSSGAAWDREGFVDVCHMPWLSLEKPLSVLPTASETKDIDVLFVGSLHGVVDHERLAWLRPIARLSELWNVVVHVHEDPVSYRPLLARARVVVNVGNHAPWLPLGLEATFSGALFCTDAANQQAWDWMTCHVDAIESTVEPYLREEHAREAMVRRTRESLSGYAKEASWNELFQGLERDWTALTERAAKRSAGSGLFSSQERMWHLITEGPATDPTLVRDLAASLAHHPNDADAHNTLGIAVSCLAAGTGPITSDIARSALEHFQRAVEANPLHFVALLNFVEVLVGLDHEKEATQHARALLERMAGLDGLDADLLDAGHFPPDVDWFRVAWERAAWQNAGNPKQEAHAKLQIIRWRVHMLLADLTGELPHYFESELAYPGVPANQAALGCKLGREGRPLDAVVHLENATRSDPLDLPAARALYHAYGETQRFTEQQRVQREAALLHRLGLLPSEPWILGTRVETGVGNAAQAPPVTSGVTPTPSYIVSMGARPAPAPSPELEPHSIERGVSLCMIVKNEEANLAACLETVRDLVDEMIVVDTGSSDATKEIARQLGAKVYDFPWIDNFAAARNESLRHATREWIFWMDADDRLDEENRQKLRTLFSQLPNQNVAYVMECLCLPDFLSGLATVVDHVRLFRNDARIRWKYRVHEQILLSVRALGGEVRWADPVIHHTGYQDPERRPAKLQRDLRLLQLDQAEHPNEPFTLFNLGWTYTELGQPAEALRFLQESLAHSGPQDSIIRKLYVLMSQCHSRLGQGQRAIEVCREGLRKSPNDPELLFEEAMLLTDQGNLPAAEACLVQLLNARDETYFASVDPALRGYKAYHQLGVIYFQQHRITEARRAWQTASSQREDYTPTLLGLLDLELAAGNWSEFDAVLERLSAMPRCQVESEVFRARAHLARKEFGPARSMLGHTIQRFPKAVWPRVILSHVQLQEHSDLDAAESALRDVLEIAPNHVQSEQNLRLLLEEKSRQAKV